MSMEWSEFVGRLRWERPRAWSMRTDLYLGEEAVATLSPPRRFGTEAVARSGEEVFILTKGGIRRPQLKIRSASSREALAVLDYVAAGRGEITFRSDGKFVLERSLDGTWSMRSVDRGLVFSIRREPGEITRSVVDVDIKERSLLPLLLLAQFAIQSSEC